MTYDMDGRNGRGANYLQPPFDGSVEDMTRWLVARFDQVLNSTVRKPADATLDAFKGTTIFPPEYRK